MPPDVSFGYLPRPQHDPHRGVNYTPTRERASATTAIDLRELAPPARFQGSLGACTGFATRGAVRGLIRATQLDGLWNSTVEFDPAPSAIYAAARARAGSLGVDGGASLATVAEVLGHGIPDERDWPYDTARWAELPPPEVFTRSRHRLTNSTPLRHQLIALRDAMHDGCIVVIGVPVFDGERGMTSSLAFSDGDVSMPSARDSIVGWHAVSVWGHDPSRDVVFFQNSWEGWATASNGLGTLPTAYVLHLANELIAFGATR